MRVCLSYVLNALIKRYHPLFRSIIFIHSNSVFSACNSPPQLDRKQRENLDKVDKNSIPIDSKPIRWSNESAAVAQAIWQRCSAFKWIRGWSGWGVSDVIRYVQVLGLVDWGEPTSSWYIESIFLPGTRFWLYITPASTTSSPVIHHDSMNQFHAPYFQHFWIGASTTSAESMTNSNWNKPVSTSAT